MISSVSLRKWRSKTMNDIEVENGSQEAVKTVGPRQDEATGQVCRTTVFTLYVTNVCKGIAVLMLLAHHLWYYPKNALYPKSLHLFALYQCKVCVAMFVMLSGASLFLSGCSWKKTYLYRIPKMLINYWLVGLVFVLVGMKFFGMTFAAAYPKGNEYMFWLQLFGINWIDPFGGFNPTWWFMDTIIPLYLATPVLFLLLKWNPMAAIFGVFFSALFPWGLQCWLTPFIFGMAAVATNAFERLGGKKNAIVGLILYSILLFFSYDRCLNIMQHFIVAFFVISIVCSLSVLGGRIFRIVFFPFSFLGRHSMNIFLLHTFFLIWYKTFFATHKPLLTYSILLGASLLCSVVIELVKKLVQLNRFFAFLKRISA